MKTEERRCMNCMEPLFEDHTCLKCGHLVDEPQLPLALPYETLLQGRYLVGRAKKHGSQGFTYIGYDKVLKNKIAIREYFPKTLCQRDINGLDSLTNQACYDLYCDYMRQFLSYSQRKQKERFEKTDHAAWTSQRRPAHRDRQYRRQEFRETGTAAHLSAVSQVSATHAQRRGDRRKADTPFGRCALLIR